MKNFSTFLMKNNLYWNKGNGTPDSSVLRKSRERKTSDQIQHLETFFQANQFIDGERLRELAQLTNLSDKQITIWFKNQRQKRKQKVDGADQQMVKHHRNEVSVLFLISYPFKLHKVQIFWEGHKSYYHQFSTFFPFYVTK